ncbi:MAG: hypothetical protein ACPGVO_21105 [Spirulinaceae cyanobacterium]
MNSQPVSGLVFVVGVALLKMVLLETAIPPLDLSVLEDLMQQRLQENLPELSPLQASCLLKQQALLMVVQHPLPELSHPKRVFRLLEVLFREQKLAERFRGLIYLQVQGQQQPYAFHTVMTSPPADDVAAQVRSRTPIGMLERGETTRPDPLSLELPEANVASAADPAAIASPPPSVLPPHLTPPPRGSVEIDEQLEPPLDARPAGPNSARPLPDFMTLDPSGDTPYGDAAYADAPYGDDEDTTGLQRWQLSDRLWLPMIAVGSVLGLGIFFGSLYALSRPCVLLGCRNLVVAQDWANESVGVLQNPSSGKAVLQAQAQLDQSIDLLERIPSWSRRYDEAQALIADYEGTAANVAELVAALQTANQAANLTQDPPLPLATWQTAVENWRAAIAQLDATPPTSEFYRFARKKIREYRQNLAVVEQRRDQEQAALENLAAAQEAAKIAVVRENIAQSAADLQLAHSTWQTVINALQEIPADSVVSAEARQLLQKYEPKANFARDRQTFEKFANDTFAQAQRSAEQAKIAQQQNQWSVAIGHWKKALTALRQIPKSSFHFTKAQPLLQNYQTALSRAESRRSGVIQLQETRDELEKLCTTETPRICSFTVNRERVKVYLTDAYVQRIEDNNRTAREQGNIEAQVSILEHIAVLEQSLERISDRVGITLEIYRNDNILIKTHNPG